MIYALLDSKSVAGAYQFEVRPGGGHAGRGHSELYPRHAINKLGIAPLTSMFLYGENTGRAFDDYRPQVHDSDGLMEQTGHGEWLWRPLGNPRELRVNRFMDENPRGFGLIQRERGFSHYQDAEAQYQRAPATGYSRWATGARAASSWWRSRATRRSTTTSSPTGCRRRTRRPASRLRFAYLLSAFAQSSQWPPGGRVVATRTSAPAMGDNKDAFRAGRAAHAHRFRRRGPRRTGCLAAGQGGAQRGWRPDRCADGAARAGERRVAGDFRGDADGQRGRSTCIASCSCTARR